ncbi:MAG: putative DNA-binding domain-containing protein [Rhodocyclaceae bacterium]|nr:putative DNA-binding domain-containing protein [Rhodocyclaceae bacterium]
MNAYRARLAEALKDNYPVLHLALGDELFDQVAAAYLEQRPSRHRSIRWFGNDLREFLDQNPDLLPHPALADLASMDWALRDAFDAADADVCCAEDLAAIAPEDWPQMTFVLHPSIKLLDLNWRIGPIWHELNEDADAVTEQPEALDHTLLVWRQKLECKWRSLGVAEALALCAAARGASFADICEVLAALDEDHAETDPSMLAASLLKQWLADSLLARAAVVD